MLWTDEAATRGRLPVYRVLIPTAEQLHDYVQRVPPLAWELLEYAQEPLEIIYPQRKYKFRQKDEPTEICVRWVKHPKLLRFLQKEGPQWAVRALPTFKSAPPAFRTTDCYDRHYPYQKVKTVAIAVDDTFTFLRT